MERVKPIVAGIFMQLGKLWKVLLFLCGSLLLFLGVLAMVSRSSDRITLSYFTRDISAIGELPFFAGLVSQLGGLLWSAALTICIFTLILFKETGRDTGQSRRFLLQAAVLTATLLLDDFFLFHEDIGPDYLHLSEKAIVLIYFILTALFLFMNFREILSSEYLILGMALAMFGLSIFIDGANLDRYDQYGLFFTEQFQIFLEDGFKFVGVATWLLFFARYAYQKILLIKSG